MAEKKSVSFGSPRPRSGKKGTKPKKIKVEDLLRQLDELTKQVDELQRERVYLRTKLRTICDQIISMTDYDQVNLDNVIDITEISAEDYLLMLTNILTRKERLIKDSLEQRVEELELRTTHQSKEIGCLLKNKAYYENALEFISRCDNIYLARQRCKALLADLNKTDPSPEYPTPAANNPISDPLVALTLFSNRDDFNDNPAMNLPDTSVFNLRNRPLSAPVPSKNRLPGSTHISEMNTGLKRYIANHLDVTRLSGADWRALAIKVGIPRELVAYWHSLNLESPTTRVLAEWERSSGATVRLLHRHLSSEQLRCTTQAKLIADFYKVE